MKSTLKKIIIFILTIEARMVLHKYKPKIIAVTGSVGKTSSKDAIYTVLSSVFFVRKSEKSFNSEIGIPLTILGVPNAWSNAGAWMKNIFEGFILIVFRSHYPKWLVLEIGADRPGDIKRVSRWLKPDVVVVTRLPEVPVHVEFFESPKDVTREKSYLVKALKTDGTLILNGDDESVLSLRSLFKGIVITFGFSSSADLTASNDTVVYITDKPIGTSFRIDYRGISIPVTIERTLGRQHMYAALSALAVGVSQNLSQNILEGALGEYKPQPGRMILLEGIKGTTIVDDSYNSSPAALQEALNILERISVTGKKIAVLGDMMELGSFAVKEHKKAGERAASIADELITVGVRAKYIAEGAHKSGMRKRNIMQFDDVKMAGKKLERKLADGDIVLIKGSQSVRMERTVEEIMAHPEKKEEFLVRQEKEWQNR